jgi:hypothetical protein
MDNAHRLQEIEIYLHSLVKSLQEGKLPVNIQNISQVFDTAIASTPRLSLPPEKFNDVYNDIPNILDAYAIAVNLSPDSYRQTNQQQIIFDRHPNGNYWIISIAANHQHAWLVPNPTRQIDLTRLNTLSFAFDWPDRDRTTDQDTFKLVEPALVSTLPTASPSWKLIKRGTISTFLNATARAHYQAIAPVPALTVVEINALVEKKFQERLVTLENELFDRLAARLPVVNSVESIDSSMPEAIASLAPSAIEDTLPANNSFSDLWRQSLSTIMLSDEPDSDSQIS